LARINNPTSEYYTSSDSTFYLIRTNIGTVGSRSIIIILPTFKSHLMTRDLKYLILGVGFLATILVFSTAVAGAIIALPALAQISGGDDDGRSSFIVDGGSARGNTSTTITDAQMHLAQAMTALQNKNTTGATMQLNLLNQSLSTLSTGAGGMTTSASIPGLGPSGGPATDGSRGPPGDRPSHSSIYGPPGSSTRPPGGRP
jgi:hypothetical protein